LKSRDVTTAPRTSLTLLSRPGCHLCEEFREELEQAFGGRFSLTEADVDSRPEWRDRFGLQIPVLLDENGALVCATRFDEQAVAGVL
jgi:hypothetical protein